MGQRTLLGIFLAVGLATASSLAEQHSELWGESGERRTLQSRLPDFSHAGYHCGEKPLPDLPPGVGVQDGKWFEAIPPSEIVPQDLHEAQLKRRLESRWCAATQP